MKTVRANQSFQAPDLAEMLYPEELAEALANCPTSLSGALDQYHKFSRDNEGDDVYTLIAFLDAHRWILQAAVNDSLSVVFAVWVY